MDSSAPSAAMRMRLLNPYLLAPRALVLYHVLVLSLAILTLDRIATYRVYPNAEATEVVVIGSQSCPHSRAVRARLIAEKIAFREIDSEANPIDSALATWAFQSLRVPIVVVGSEVIFGNRAEQIDAALARLGLLSRASHPSSLLSPTAEAKPPSVQGDHGPESSSQISPSTELKSSVTSGGRPPGP